MSNNVAFYNNVNNQKGIGQHEWHCSYIKTIILRVGMMFVLPQSTWHDSRNFASYQMNGFSCLWSFVLKRMVNYSLIVCNPDHTLESPVEL